MDTPIAVKDTLRELLHLEDELDLVMVIPMGVPESTEVKAPERLPVEEVMRFHQP